MANVIKPKRSNTASAVPTTGQLASGELAVNMADQKVYINNGTSVVQVGAGNLTGLGDVNVTSPTNNQILKYDSTTSKWINGSGGGGSGDVVGPVSSTDNAITRFDGSTGTLIQNSTVTINDDGTFANVNGITFDTTPTNAPTATGSMFWDSGDGTPSVVLNANTSLQLGQENVALVYNGTGSTITRGSVVSVIGAQGQRPSVALADADSESLSSATLGVAAEDITNGSEGFICTFGLVRGLDTSAFTAGQAIYLSQTAGQFTATKPTAPANTVAIGWVIKVNASSGEIFINISNGWELDEIHDVQIISPANGNTLIYDASAGVWKNAGLTAGTAISVTNGAGSVTINNTGVTSAVAGTGISVSSATGAVTVTNTAPDQTVSLTNGGAIGISGTYPNFTLTNNGVTSVAGTTNQITASASTGSVTLSLPATINVNTTGTASNVTGTVAIANGGTGATNAGTARSNLGGTTVGQNLFTLTNPSAVTFPRFNADNTVSALDAATFRTAIGAGTGSGTVTSVSGTGSYGGLTLTGTVTSSGSLTLGGTPTGTWPISVSGSAASAASATTASQIDGIEFRNGDSSNAINPDSVNNNGTGYINSVSLFGQSDGALYSQAYSTSWVHQIFGDYRTGQLAVRGRNNGTLTAWRTILDSSNYTSYAPTLTGGGASGTWSINITGNAGSVTDGVYLSGTQTITGIKYFQSNLGSTSGSLSNPPLQAYASGSNSAFMSFHRGGSYAVNMGLDSDNVLRIGGWSASANRWQLDMSGNQTLAGSMAIGGGFTIDTPGSGYGRFNNWVNLNGFYGFYSGNNNAHIYPNNASYGSWRIVGSRNGWAGFEFDSTNGNTSLMIEANSSTVGFHNNTYGWRLRVVADNAYIYSGSYGGGTERTILHSGNFSSYAYPTSNPNGYTSNTGTVTSVSGTGTVSGLTLSGTVTTSGSLSLGGSLSAAASAITSGTFDKARMPTGSILQVVQTNFTNQTIMYPGNTWTDLTGMNVTITPRSTSSTIKLNITIQGSTNSNCAFRLVRGTTPIALGTASGSRTQSTFTDFYKSGSAWGESYSFTFVDSPATTSATTYKIQVWTYSTGYYFYSNMTYGGSDAFYVMVTPSTMIASEIQG